MLAAKGLSYWLASLVGPLVLGHPLGDRTFDRAIQVVVLPNKIQVEYQLGVSELTLITELLSLVEPGQVPANPAQAIQQYQTVIFPILGRGLVLSIDGSEAALVPVRSETPVRRDHVQYTFHFEAPLTPLVGPREIRLIDTNFPGERGYRRLALKPGKGMRVLKSSAPLIVVRVPLVPTWEMTPEEDEASTKVAARVQADAAAILAKALEREPPPEEPLKHPHASTLRDLLSRGESFALVLLLAFVFGMAHAVKPGHGKTMVAAYLIGQQGTVYHAMLLGLVTTITHTGTVLFVALMLRPLAGTRWANQETLSFWLTLLSGILVAWLGATLLWRRLRGKEDLLHVHGPGGHVHLPDGTVQWLDAEGRSATTEPRPDAIRLGNLMTLGFSGGLIPCDDAVLLLLAAIGAGLLAQAIYILLAFSAGLAAVLVLIGILVVKIKGFAATKSSATRFLYPLQVGSAGLITFLGLWLCYHAFHPGTPLL